MENTPELCLIWLEIRLSYLQGGQTVLEQYIDGAAAVDQYSVELDLVDIGSRTRGKRPGSGIAAHWSFLLKEISR